MSPFSSPLLLFLALLLVVVDAGNICGENRTLGQAVLSVMNLSYPGLEQVAKAESAGDLDGACEALAAYYQDSNTSFWLRIPPVPPGTGRVGKGSEVDNAVDYDIYYMGGVDTTGKIPRNPDGGLDWVNKGPNDDPEFMNCLNRFDVFGWLLAAYKATGNPVYVDYFSATMQDWVTHNPCPNSLGEGSAPLCSPQGVATHPQCSWDHPPSPTPSQTCATGTFESPWRSLEMGIRTNGVFASAFFGFQHSPNFTTSARVLTLLAMGEHNQGLVVDGGHPGMGTPNWEIGQWSGLVTSTVTFPELSNASGLQRAALAELEALFTSLVYPDGVETEMASGYDLWTALESYSVMKTLSLGGAPPPPPSYATHVEAMYNYGSYILDPNGCLPRNGDSDLCGSGYSAEQALYFQRPDWTYVATHGAQGTPPPTLATQGPSSMFPYAGQVALRSDFSANATWAFFDVGPFGSSGHAHRDKLHLNLHAKGAMLLVDSGRFAYAGAGLSNTLHLGYARHTHAHNTITLDGADQLPLPAVVDAPIAEGTYNLSLDSGDWVWAAMGEWDAPLVGNAVHTRGMFYQRVAGGGKGGVDGDFLVVVDAITTDRPRAVECTWHAHPNATGVSAGSAPGWVGRVGGATTHTGQPTPAQACIIPANGAGWDSAVVVKGVADKAPNGTTYYQGWYSQEYEDAWEAPTLVYKAAGVGNGAVFGWLIVPTFDTHPCGGSGGDTLEVLDDSHREVGVVVKATVGGVQHTITVPMVW
jgi:hypothetical protein